MKKTYNRRKIQILFLIFLFFISLSLGYFLLSPLLPRTISFPATLSKPPITSLVTSPSPFPSPSPIPSSHIIPLKLHVFQTFNNCGPASLSMLLSYFNIQISQKDLGEKLRPYQNPQGDNDDKSVTFEELASEAKNHGLVAYHRPNGNLELLKKLIAFEIPVLVRTWTKPNEDIGHFRVVRGYDNITDEIIQDDSLQGENLRYKAAVFNQIWQGFNYEYLILVPVDKKTIVEEILSDNLKVMESWSRAAKGAQDQLINNPENLSARFNLSVAFYNTGEFQKSIEEFEKIENRLPFRTLWYQIEPIEAYFALGNYQRVFALTNGILNNGNRAFSELYIIRGKIYQKQGNIEAARSEFEKAVFYNENMQDAQEAMNSI